MKRILFLWCLLIATVSLHAQKLAVEKMEMMPMDLSASTQQRNDRNGNACALVKVQLATAGASFEGNVIGDAEFKKGEYWVYMSEGSYMLNVKHPDFLPLFVNFRDYGINKVEQKTTYVLTLVMPQGSAPVQTQKLTINYTPTTAIVVVDSKSYQGNGSVEVELPVGSHDYQIVAVGYSTAEGSVKLNADMPRTITEHLVATAQQSVVAQQPARPVVQQPVQPAVSPATTDSPVETFTVNGVSFNMVRVEGGTFQMGSRYERPEHQVTLSTYSIGETEVTQALWETVMGSNPSNWKGENLPVESVNWKDCQVFIKKLNELTKRKFRLPTEAEWEYAARGGNKSRGYKYAGSNTIDDVAWYKDNSGEQTHQVKAKRANELGLYDMSGNVEEWCQDWYGGYSSDAQINPTGPGSTSYRVIRGGGWNDSASSVSFRYGSMPGYRGISHGLRIAL